MTKEEALKKIEELKEYVEKCEEKEKEIPEIPRQGNYNVRLVVPDKPRNPYIWWDRSFENQESADLYNILSFELAQLIYAREYLGVKNKDIREARIRASTVFCVSYLSGPSENKYVVIEVEPLMHLRPHELIWCFTDNLEAHRVCDYMNKYVKDVKKNMF